MKVGKLELQQQQEEEEFPPCLHPYLALEHLLPPHLVSSSLVLARRRLTWGGCRRCWRLEVSLLTWLECLDQGCTT